MRDEQAHLQTHLEGYGALPGNPHAPVGATYVRSVQASAKHNSDWVKDPVRREKVRRGALKAVEARKLHLEKIAQERDRAILKLIRIAPAPKTQRQVHDLYLRTCHEQGWPEVSYRMFGYYVRRLVDLGRVKTRVVSIGKGGRFTLLRVVVQEEARLG